MTRPMSRRRSAVAATCLVVCILVLGGCGGGSSSSSASDPSGTSASEPSAEFLGKGQNGELASAGKESSAAERQAASAVLEKNFEARAAGDWSTQCATLAGSVIDQLEESASKGSAKGEGKTSCSAVIEALAGTATKGALRNTMAGSLAALRVNGSQAFAFYHGAGGKDYVIPMEEEGGEWKVAALGPQEAP